MFRDLREHGPGDLKVVRIDAIGERGLGGPHYPVQASEQSLALAGQADHRGTPVFGHGGAGDQSGPLKLVDPLDDRGADHVEVPGEIPLDNRAASIERGEDGPAGERRPAFGQHGIEQAPGDPGGHVDLTAERIEANPALAASTLRWTLTTFHWPMIAWDQLDWFHITWNPGNHIRLTQLQDYPAQH